MFRVGNNVGIWDLEESESFSSSGWNEMWCLSSDALVGFVPECWLVDVKLNDEVDVVEEAKQTSNDIREGKKLSSEPKNTPKSTPVRLLRRDETFERFENERKPTSVLQKRYLRPRTSQFVPSKKKMTLLCTSRRQCSRLGNGACFHSKLKKETRHFGFS